MDVSFGMLFVVNLLLTLADASLGYHLAPVLVSMRLDEEGEPFVPPQSLRRFLGVVVGLFTLLNCIGYFGENRVLLMVLTAAILLDMVIMVVICRRIVKRKG